MMLKTYLAVMAGGAVGTGLRMALAGWLTARYGEAFPVGTLVVNVTGCFVIGAFAALTPSEQLEHVAFIRDRKLLLGDRCVCVYVCVCVRVSSNSQKYPIQCTFM